MAKIVLEFYRLDITNQTFTRFKEVITHQNVRWIEKKNAVGGMTFSLDIDDPVATVSNLQRYSNYVTVKEYRNDSDGIGMIHWAGLITDVNFSFSGTEGEVSVQVNTPFFDFADRVIKDTDRVFEATDIGEIMWTLIDESQNELNGWLGIYQGNTTTGVVKDKTFQRGTDLQSAITSLSANKLVNGCDFTFDPITNEYGLLTGFTFNTHYPTIGSLREDLVALEVGANIQSIRGGTNGKILNYLIGLGAGSGDGVLTSPQFNVGSQLTYKVREGYYSNKDIEDQTTLDEITAGELNKKSADTFQISVTLHPNKLPLYKSYVCGDYLKLNLRRGFMQFSYWAMVKEINCTLDSQGVIRVEPVLVII